MASSDHQFLLTIDIESLTTGTLPNSFIEQLSDTIQKAAFDDLISIALDLSDSQPSFDELQKALAVVYVQAERQKARMDRVLIQIDVVVLGFSRCSPPLVRPGSDRADTVALGGTFDHLHSGHKILLTMAAWLASRRVIVGVTDEALLTNKRFAEHLQPLGERIASVKSFLLHVGPTGLEVDTPSLQDIYGPTATEPDIQAIIVSKETLSGADAINQLRTKNGLGSLRQYVIDVISPSKTNLTETELKELKMSSTEIRRWLKEHGQGATP